MRGRIAAALTLVALLGLATPAGAQGDISKRAPISLETDSPSVPSGSTIVLRGKTIAIDARRPIGIVVTWLRPLSAAKAAGSAPAPESLSAPYGVDGAFQLAYRTSSEGVYRASATSPDGSGNASTEFRVSGFGEWSAEQSKAVGEALDASSELVDALEQLVAAQQDSPARRRFEDKLKPLRKALAERKTVGKSVADSLDFYGRIAGEVGLAAPAFEPLTRAVKEFRRESAEVLVQIRAATAEAKARNRGCEDLVKVEEGFKLLSTMINFASKFHETLLAFTIDFATSVAANKAPASCGDSCKFALTQAVKQRDWIKTGAEQARERSFAAKAFFDGVPGFLADTGAFASHALFDHYCERFEGPLDAATKVEFFKNGEIWWRYTIKIKGLMTLAYKKGADPKQPIPMAGHLVGTGTEFTVAEDALRVLHARLLAGATVIGRTTAPIGFPFLDFPGAVALQSVPTAFFMVVEGELANGVLKLKLGPSRTDFNKTYTVANGRYLIAGGYAGALAGYTTFDIGYDSARGLVEKATDIDIKTLDLPVIVGKDKMTASGSYNTTRGKPVKARGEYQLKLMLCNPKC